MKKKNLSIIGFGVVMVLLTIMAAPVGALPITFSGSNTNGLSASATFEIVGASLWVTLTNTSPVDVSVPSQILTALFFDITGNPLLSASSATLASGSSVLFGGSDPGGVVGGEWAYTNSANVDEDGNPISSLGGASQGISSSGFGIPYAGNFPGSNLQGPPSPDGVQYGITSGADDPLTGNTPVTGSNALIKNSVVFLLSNLQGNFSLDTTISNIQFQYGTSLSDPSFGTPVPEPATMLLLGSGLIGLAGYGRKKFRKQLPA